LSTTSAVSRNLFSVFLMSTAQMLVIVCVALVLMSSLISVLFGRDGNGDQVPFGWVRQIVAWLLAVGISFIVLGMFPAQIVSASVQTWLVCGAIWIGFGAVFLGLLYLFRRRFKLPAGQVAGLAIVTSLPMLGVYVANIIDLVVAGTATLHPVISITLILLLALICWASFHFLWKFIQNQNLTRRRKLLAVGIVFLFVMVTVPAGITLGMMAHEIGTQAWISPTVWKEAHRLNYEADELQSAMQMDDSRWAWAFIQWQAHHGPVVAPIIAVVIVMVWHLIRRAGRVEGGLRQVLRSQKRSELRQSGKSVAGSCLVTAFIFLAMYLGTTPLVVDMMDTYHRVHYARVTRPAQAWEEIAELTAEIKADKETMARLQAEIDEQNRQIAEQAAWQEDEE
ncbi:MAG: hypothetical protein JW829_10800, partial [Pirellulales bacterium]|nr:hypothetical protein [Pirellulales bacterium]